MTDGIYPPHDVGNPERRAMLIATSMAGGAAAAIALWPFVSSLAPSDRALAQGAPVEVDISDLAPGSMKTVEWRGKPVWILRRTPEMLVSLKGTEPRLADPESRLDALPEDLRNIGRSRVPEVLVVIGICTHLGCAPNLVPSGTANASVGDDWPGGFFCPCHGSTFDLAGRVFKDKPAPTNLVVPPHRYLSETRILVGESDAA